MIQATEEWLVRKRDGRVVPFDPSLIERALGKAFRAELTLDHEQPLDADTKTDIARMSEEVLEEISPLARSKNGVEVEKVQDFVEMTLMRHGHFRVARRYIVYRAERAKLRALRAPVPTEDEAPAKPRLHVTLDDGVRVPFDEGRIRRRLAEACRGLERECNAEELLEDVMRSVFDGIKTREVYRAMILASRSRIERDPAYDTVASRLMLMVINQEALGRHESDVEELEKIYRKQFEHYVIDGITEGRLSSELRRYDLCKVASALKPERDHQFKYLGLQAIYDRYLLHVDGRRIETPQFFWMRVALGLAMEEGEDRHERAVEFYDVLSSFRFTSATPTLFNSATLHPQLSSCYLTTVMDDLDHIFKCVSDNAKLSKWAGGLGNDWTNIRSTGAMIKGTNGQSQGVIPFLKVVNDTAVAVNQGGKRKGAVCSYLETWHLDIEEFLDLRKNTGDDRRRTHDMNTANWIPDLFMKRVREEASLDALQPGRSARPARPVRSGLPGALRAVRATRGRREDQAAPPHRGRRSVAEDAHAVVRDGASLGHVQGPVEHSQPAGSCGCRPLVEPVYRDPAQHEPRRNGRLQSGQHQSQGPHRRWSARPGSAPRHGANRDADAR